jgi:capsid protein
MSLWNTIRAYLFPATKTRPMTDPRLSRIKATYDAARNGDEYKRIWENADRMDADSAHDKEIRHTLISRSRYETANNGYADGIAQTYANDLVGNGPQLRMQTSSPGFNQLVERTWHDWYKAVQFRRKLWCMAHAKHQDGEAFAVLRRNPGVTHPVKLEPCLYEAEQIQTPYMNWADKGQIDGIKFDEFGNPLWYDVLLEHPGATFRTNITQEAEQVAADKVIHWFKMRRPGQHRAVPECASTLNLGAAFRRLREANLSTSEKVAAWTLFLKTMFQPDELDTATPMSTLEIEHGLMTALPNSVEPIQLKAEHPGPSYDSFHRSLLNEQARPKNMPFNKAACDSSDYNYASGRLDHQTYYQSLDIDREDCNDIVLDPLFRVWFELAVVRFGWLGGNPESLQNVARLHVWDWPKHRVADVEAEANANDTKLKSGQIFPHMLFTDAGMDFEDELEKASKTYGVTTDALRKRLLDTNLPEVQQGGAPGQPDPTLLSAAIAYSLTRGGLNGHSNGHANGAHANGN